MNRFENWVVDTPTWITIPTMLMAAVALACAIGIPVGYWLNTIL